MDILHLYDPVEDNDNSDNNIDFEYDPPTVKGEEQDIPDIS